MAERDSPVVTATGVRVELGGRTILDDISFACAPGEWVGVSGPSGVGKTTLLRTVNGLCAPAAGTVEVLGTKLPGRTRNEARGAWRQTGTVLQELALFETRSVRRNVELALRAAGAPRESVAAEAAAWLERLGLARHADAPPVALSVGERQRVALARALAPRPPLVVLDEPTSALDSDSAGTVLAALSELCETGSAVLMASHREDELRGRCDRRLVLSGGRIRRLHAAA